MNSLEPGARAPNSAANGFESDCRSYRNPRGHAKADDRRVALTENLNGTAAAVTQGQAAPHVGESHAVLLTVGRRLPERSGVEDFDRNPVTPLSNREPHQSV